MRRFMKVFAVACVVATFPLLLSAPGVRGDDPPQDSVWYLAEGSSDWGFECYLTIANPVEADVTVTLTFMTTRGPIQFSDVVLYATSQTTIFPADLIGEQDFSTMVVCDQGAPIAVDREMFWTGAGQPEGREGAHGSIGVTAPAKTWYLAEGSSKWGFECWLLIQNPNTIDAECQVTYMIEGAGPMTVTKTVPATARRSFFMADDIGSQDASIKVSSNIPVIPERAMYRNGRREGHDSIGTTTPSNTYYLAEGTTGYGFTNYVLVQNPNDAPAEINVTYMTSSGPVEYPRFEMPPQSRRTLRVNDFLPDTDASTQVSASVPIIAERAMYWDNGTGEAMHDSIGVAGPHQRFFLPDGRTDAGFETYTLVQNPNPVPVDIELLYLFEGGGTPSGFTDRLPARSRRTYDMSTLLGRDRYASVMVASTTPGRSVIVERAIYGQNRGSGTDTVGGYYDAEPAAPRAFPPRLSEARDRAAGVSGRGRWGTRPAD